MTDPYDFRQPPPTIEKLDGLGWSVIVMAVLMLGWLAAHRLGWL